MHEQLAAARGAIDRRIPASRFSENRQLTLQEALDYTSDSSQVFQVNKSHPKCLFHCTCTVCEATVYLFGLSNMHFCLEENTAIKDANTPVISAKILYPVHLFMRLAPEESEKYTVVKRDQVRFFANDLNVSSMADSGCQSTS